MANFEEAYSIMLRNEGGYSNIAADKGGETYKGIARNFWPNWSGWAIIDGIKAVRKINWNEEIQDTNLKLSVKNFYKVNFWNKMSGSAIQDQFIANVLFDSFVLMGGNAVKMAQRLLTYNGYTLLIDGALGPKTLNAINTVNQEFFYHAFLAARKEYHEARAKSDVSQLQFLKGWLARVDKFPAYLKKKALA